MPDAHLIAEHDDPRENDLHGIAQTGMAVDAVDHVHHSHQIEFRHVRMREEFGHTGIGDE